MTGVVPFGLSGFQEGVGRLLMTVSDLKDARLPAWDETLWVGTALLVAGGAAHVVSARPTPRGPADPRARARQFAPDDC
jgi:hypothetical protein